MAEKLGVLSKKVYIFRFFIIGLIALGIWLRADLYFFNRSLWFDEASLWMNIKYSGFLELLKGLKYNQGAPPMFLWEAKFLEVYFGDSEKVLRFIPFFSGVLAIPIFYIFSSLFLKTKVAKIFAMFLFSVNTNLIYYSQEFKQYSSDVLLSMLLIIYVAKRKLEKPLEAGLLFSVCMWYSHACIVAAVGLLAGAGWHYIKEKKVKNLLIFTGVCALNGLLYYVINLRHLKNQDYLNDVWATSFIRANFSNFWDLLIKNVYYLFQPIKFFGGEHAVLSPIILLALCIFGVFFVYRANSGNRLKFWLLLGPYLALLLLAYLQIYPYYDRVTLFLTPIFIVLLTKNFDKLAKWRKSCAALALLGMLLLLNPVAEAQKFMKNMPQQDRAIFLELKENYKSGQKVVVNPASVMTFNYYRELFGLEADVVTEKTYDNEVDYIKFLLSLENGGEYWFYTSNIFEKYNTKPLIELWGKDCKEYFHYNKRKSDLYYVKTRETN